MVFSPLHWIPSALAALPTFRLAFNVYGKPHKALSAATILIALLGLVGYVSAGNLRFFPMDFHTFHAWIGLTMLILSIFLFINKPSLHTISQENIVGLARWLPC